ncbi:hypothetical protein KIN20_014619 [Parelaphostrongylus tenuis]|uniref:Uncharacterized protein n=1 Tax=Parelaphostrongylus tenuis TaxID=148309 RepID=A0AAD5QNI9_PARTN|nr:hypothetical protein KIN20_014619 [Parelaphostrongylus tenuis]
MHIAEKLGKLMVFQKHSSDEKLEHLKRPVSLVLHLTRRQLGFVERLVTQTVFDILERQGRSALLPDAVISTILGQLNVTINYSPMSCQIAVELDDMHAKCLHNRQQHCDGNLHEYGSNVAKKCPMDANVQTTPVNGTFLTIPGTLSTTNIVMANWSRMMWQSVVDRAVRMLASGPFGSHFFSAMPLLAEIES